MGLLSVLVIRQAPISCAYAGIAKLASAAAHAAKTLVFKSDLVFTVSSRYNYKPSPVAPPADTGLADMACQFTNTFPGVCQ